MGFAPTGKRRLITAHAHSVISPALIAALRKDYSITANDALIRSLITYPNSGPFEPSAASPTSWSAFPLTGAFHVTHYSIIVLRRPPFEKSRILAEGIACTMPGGLRTNAVSISI